MRLAVLLSVLVFASAEAFADEVVMKNGDKITGKVLDLGGGKLKVETPHSGVVILEWAQVASVKTDAAVKVKLTTGEVFEGKLGAGQDGKILVESPGAQTEVTPDKFKSLNEPPVAWHGSVDVAGRKTDGNTHNTSMLLMAEALRTSEKDRILLKLVFRYGESDDVITERNSYAIAKYDYLITDRLYAYASGELVSDKFKDLTLRTILAVGMGYIFEKSKDLDFWGDAGFAYVDNDHRDAEDESYPGGRFSAHLRKSLPLGFELIDDVVFLPNFEEGDAWLLRNELALATALGHGLSFKAGMITDYDNDPPDDVREHDNTYYFGVGFKF